jgi:oligoribonuclease NrnB/cAMP/cGMP phosphodiesterase (DHH superfamily)
MTLERLKQIRKLITHANCMDGLATALIVKDALPEVEVEFVQYNTKEHRELKAEPGLLFCDFTPPRERVQEFVEVGALVCDHHKYARDIVEAFGYNGIFADETTEPGVSGAMLAFTWVWEWMARDSVAAHATASWRRFARLVGVRDTWQRDSHEWEVATQLHAVLESFPAPYWFGLRTQAAERALQLTHSLGPELLAEKDKQVAKAHATGLIRRNVAGRSWALSAVHASLVSDLGDTFRESGGAVLVNITPSISEGGFRYSVSLRSNGSVDVGKLALRYGGGGHSRAAGFSVLGGNHPIELFAWLGDASIG